VCCAIKCGAKSYAAIAQWVEDQDIEEGKKDITE